MAAANEECFSQPHWEVIARGLSPESWFEKNEGRGTGGMERPRPVNLRTGQRYYRFASSTTSPEAQVGGGWWLEYESFRRIETFAREGRMDLADAARLFLALPYEWTRVDRLVSAILALQLKAYAGFGKVAAGSRQIGSNTWTPVAHKPVVQLYIPGLFVPGRKPQLHTLAFPSPRIEFVHGNRRTV